MLERGCGRHARSGLELLDQLPRIERVKEVDVAGTTVDYLDGEFAFLHVNT